MQYLAALALLIVPFTVGCFGSDANEQEPKEIEADSAITSDAPEAVLLQTAKRLYGNGLYSVAKDSFEALRATYPLGPYAEFAHIKIADCLFLAKEYEAAAATYESFLKEHPTSPTRDYVTFKTGLSHHLNTKGVGRDVGPTKLAISFFKDTIQQFPDSPYATSSRYYLQEGESMVAMHEKEVLDFYKRQGLEEAYENRLAEYKTNFENKSLYAEDQPLRNDSPTTPEIITTSTASPQIVFAGRESQNTARASLRLPEPNVFPARRAAPYKRLQGDLVLQTVKCSGSATDNNRQITLTFDDSASSSELVADIATKLEEITPHQQTLRIKLPALNADVRKYNCFSKEDIAVTDERTVEIQSNQKFSLMHLEYPNRLLLIED